MANYNLVVNSQFKPFSYQELLSPVMMATQAQQELENQYSTLSGEASVYANQANAQTDPNAYNTYKKYSDDLATQADALVKSGLNTNSRSSLVNLRSRYNKDIVPINQAVIKRAQLAEDERKAFMQNPTLLVKQRASSLSIDDLISNPNYTPDIYSGALVTQQVMQQAANLKNELAKYGKGQKIDGFTNTFIQQHGLSKNDINKFLTNPESSPVLKQIRDAVTQPLIDRGFNSNEVMNYANQGLWSAIGQTNVSPLENKGAVFAAQEAAEIRKENRAFNQKLDLLQAKASQGSQRTPYDISPKTTVNGEVPTTAIQKDIDFIHEINKNPGILNQAKKVRINTSSSYDRSIGAPSTYKETNTYPNADRLKALTKKYNTKDPNKLLELMQRDIESSAVRDFEYRTNFTDNKYMAKNIKEGLQVMARNQQVFAHDFSNGKLGSRIKGDDIDKIGDDGFTSYNYDNNVPIYNYKDKDGKSKSIAIDTEVLDDKSRTLYNINNRIKQAKNNKDYKSSAVLIDEYMRFLDNKFNNLSKIQSGTDNDLDPMW